MSHNIMRSKLTKEYEAYLASPRWNFFRLMIIEKRVGCEVCGSREYLHVHHRHYNNLGHEKDEDVVLLCKTHHNKLHAISGSHFKTYDEALMVVINRFQGKSQRKRKKKRIRHSYQKIIHKTKKQKYATIMSMKDYGRIRAEENKRAKELRAERIKLFTN